MFKFLHNLLPTRDRIDRFPCPGIKDDIYHALTQCQISKCAADFVLKIIRKLHPNAIMFDVLYLQCDMKGVLDLPITWITINCIHITWSHRLVGGITPNRLFAELMALHKIFKNTKLKVESLIVSLQF